MAHKTVYDKIKKQNGEAFAQAIRRFDNGIFEIPDIVEIVRYAGRDAEPVLQYLESLKHVHIHPQKVHKDPFVLLKKAGYDAYFADTLEKQNAIQKYFFSGEELCTFDDPNRFKDYYIVNAVRRQNRRRHIRGADELDREEFRGHEQRDDEYGTSVISIQIQEGEISIKNRYNHSVDFCDNTFDSDPDNIIKGLADALRHYFHVDFSSKRNKLPEGFTLLRNKIAKINNEINNVRFGKNFYIKHGRLIPIDSDTEILMDHFVFSLKDKSIVNIAGTGDSFPEVFENEIKGKKVRLIKEKNQQHLCVVDPKDKSLKKIVTVQNGKITALHLESTKEIGNNFLRFNETISEFTAPHLEHIQNNFLESNKILQTLSLPALVETGDSFLKQSDALTQLDVPNLKKTGHYFLERNQILELLNAPQLEEVGDEFLEFNENLRKLYLPNLRKAGHSFLWFNIRLEELALPCLERVDNYFLYSNKGVEELYFPHLKEVGNDFLPSNKQLKTVMAPLLEKVGDSFLVLDEALESLSLPSLKITGNNFISDNKKLSTFVADSLEQVGDFFLSSNTGLTELYFPQLKKTGDSFVASNRILKKLTVDSLENVGKFFLCCNKKLTELYVPLLHQTGEAFLEQNRVLRCLNASQLVATPEDCLALNRFYKTNAPVLIKRLSPERHLKITPKKSRTLRPRLKAGSTRSKFQNTPRSPVQLKKGKEILNPLMGNQTVKQMTR